MARRLTQHTLQEGMALLNRQQAVAAEGVFRAILARGTVGTLALHGLGKALYDQRRFAEAERAFANAAQADPTPDLGHYHQSLCRLIQGDLSSSGWAGWEARPALREVTSQWPLPRWQGEPLAGQRLLVLLEQGYGDVLQFIRFAPRLRSLGAAAVAVQTVPPLTRLLQPFAARHGLDLVSGTVAPAAYDRHLLLCSLPAVLKVGLADLPGVAVPYLNADPLASAHYRAGLPKGRRALGLCWEGRASHPQDASRSLDPALLLPVAQQTNVYMVGLQRPPWRNRPPSGLLNADWGATIDDFATLAAMIAALDGVITVDTAVAHLAGALGCPTWLLLPFCPDWRWLLDRPDSPWYPSVRLVRQKVAGDWSAVIAQLVRALQDGPNPTEVPTGD